MSSRTTRDSRSQVTRRAAPGRGNGPGSEPRSRRPGLHLGPFAVTPARTTLLVALVGGLAFLAYSLLVRDALQVPLLATGLAICGIVFGLMAVLAVVAVVRAGHERRDGSAVFAALVGGVLAVMSLMSLAAATIFAMIWSGTKAG